MGEVDAGRPDRDPAPLRLAFLGDPNSIHLRRWAGWFAERGHAVTLLVPRDQAVQPGLPAGLAVERFGSQNARRLRGFGMLGTRRAVRDALARTRPDVLHVHHLTVNGFRAWLSGFHPYVVTVWGTDVLITARRSGRAWILARLALGAADLVTGISNHVVEGAVRVGARADRARPIHFGIDVDRFSPGPDPVALRERLGLRDRRVIFSPRAIAPIYRHEIVIDALADLPDDVVLLMTRYLADPREEATLERLVVDRGLQARVVMVPGVPYSEMPDFYRLADVVASVPESDAGPITLVEALAVGRTTVCSDLPPAREWLAELDPECLVPVGDSAATARAIAAVLARSRPRRDELAALGRKMVLERADQRRNMAQMETLYRRLAAGLSVTSVDSRQD